MGNQRKFPKYCVLDLFIYIVWTGISETHGQIFLVSSLSKTFRTTIIFPFAPGVFVFTRAARDLSQTCRLFFVWILWLFEDFPHRQMLYLICFIRYTRVDGDWALVSWSIQDVLLLSTSRCSMLYSFRTVFLLFVLFLLEDRFKWVPVPRLTLKESNLLSHNWMAQIS